MTTIALRNTDDVSIKSYTVRATRNREHLEQFKSLLRDLYVSDERMAGFRDDPLTNDEHYSDPDNHTILVIQNNRIVGGACLRISSPEYPIILHLETDILPLGGKFYFSLREHFPMLELDQYVYAECNDIALHPDFRNGEILRSLLGAVAEYCNKYHVRYLFGLSTAARLRTYKSIFASLGESHSTICHQLDIPMKQKYEGQKMHLLCGESKSFSEGSRIYAVNAKKTVA